MKRHVFTTLFTSSPGIETYAQFVVSSPATRCAARRVGTHMSSPSPCPRPSPLPQVYRTPSSVSADE